MTQIDYNKFWSPAFDGMEDFVFLLDENHNFIKANKSFVKFVGKSENDLVGKKCYSVVHNSTKPPPNCPHQKALKTKCFERTELFDQNLKKWFSVTVTPIFDEGHNCIGSIHIASDLTEYKRMEEGLKEEKGKFRTVVESAQDAISIKDKKGCYAMINPAGAKLFGMRPQDIQGKTDLELFGSKAGKEFRELDKKVMLGKTPYAYEKERVCKDVKRFLRTVKVPYISLTGEVMGLIDISRDLTEERMSAKIVRFYREYAENIVGNLPLSLLIVNRDLRVNFANQHFLSRMRLTRDDITEKELTKVMGSSIVESSKLNEKIIQIIKREAERVEGRFAIKGRTFDYMIVPLKEQTGKRLNAMLIMEDVTKNVAMEEQLIHSEKLSAVGTFTASVAHEINNPLSIVVGNIQYLLSNIQNMNIPDKKEVEALVETLTNANTEARRCAEIVTNLLHFSHKGKGERTKLSINSAVGKTMKLLEHKLELSKVQAVIKLADDLPPVMGNAEHLQQAFVNLILNAEQVMKSGGKLYITTALDDNFVTISFRDTGPGIPKKYIRKIFEPFYSTKEAGKGTGLGLFIIHSIVEEHAGVIEVQSKRGHGANFILKLPVAKKTGWFA